jgi:hypothetical protein
MALPLSRHRVALIPVVAALWLAATAAKAVRPFMAAYAPDWLSGVMGSAPSLLGGLSVPLCFIIVHPKPDVQCLRTAFLWALTIVVLAEILERYLPNSTFDWRDLIASLVGVGAAALLSLPFVREHRFGVHRVVR